MKTFKISEAVKFDNKKALIADRLNGRYLLWDKTGKKELDVYSKYPDGWVPADKLTRGW